MSVASKLRYLCANHRVCINDNANYVITCPWCGSTLSCSLENFANGMYWPTMYPISFDKFLKDILPVAINCCSYCNRQYRVIISFAINFNNKIASNNLTSMVVVDRVKAR